MDDFNLIRIDKSASSEIIRENYKIDQTGITSWLITKNLISEKEKLIEFQDLTEWKMLGGETYCTTFRFVTNKHSKHILIKALVTISPETNQNGWINRRNILSQNGIPVSRWYRIDNAVIFEDFYPNTFEKVSFYKLLEIGWKLDKLGFTTLSFLNDIRADEKNNPYYIDFGFDLGEPSPMQKKCARNNLILKYPDMQNEIIQFYNKMNNNINSKL